MTTTPCRKSTANPATNSTRRPKRSRRSSTTPGSPPRWWLLDSGLARRPSTARYTSNDPKCRNYAIERSLRCIDIAKDLGTDLIVLWLAREGTYLRESKNGSRSFELLVEAIDKMLAHDKKIRIAIEPKPNEPMDHAYIPTIGHALALAHLTRDPKRVGCLIESAHAILAGLDPADEIDFAMTFGKLWSLHLNDQNGLKFDQDKPFGSSNLRGAFNQIRALERGGYGKKGEYVCFDVHPFRTTKVENWVAHLENSRRTFLRLLEKARSFDEKTGPAVGRQTRLRRPRSDGDRAPDGLVAGCRNVGVGPGA